VRELENLLHRAVALAGNDSITLADLDLPESAFSDSTRQELELAVSERSFAHVDHRGGGETAPMHAVAPLPNDLASYLDGVERDILVRALERHRFNRTAAGASLGLSLRQMRYRMARLGVLVAENGVTVGNESELDGLPGGDQP
jgi:two-component system response regulator PilR (NtrC family)